VGFPPSRVVEKIVTLCIKTERAYDEVFLQLGIFDKDIEVFHVDVCYALRYVLPISDENSNFNLAYSSGDFEYGTAVVCYIPDINISKKKFRT
jgi:hypothetical protein